MVLHVLARSVDGGDPVAAMTKLLTDNHEPAGAQGRHVRRAIAVYRSLRAAGVIERPWVEDPTAPHGRRRGVRLTHDLPANFALNQALSPFAYAALDLLDREDHAYAHDVVSVIEATLDDPRQVLAAQENRARGEAVAAMKADGIEYDERMALLEGVTYPRPLAELLDAAFVLYRQTNPWVADLALSPKSVVREMHERASTFAEYVSHYQLDRTEGVLLRYLADAYRALRQTVPEDARTEESGSSSSGSATWCVAPTRACSTSGSDCPTRSTSTARTPPAASTRTLPSLSPPTPACCARWSGAPCSAGSSSRRARRTARSPRSATSTRTASPGRPSAGRRRSTRSTTTTTRSSPAHPRADRRSSRSRQARHVARAAGARRGRGRPRLADRGARGSRRLRRGGRGPAADRGRGRAVMTPE